MNFNYSTMDPPTVYIKDREYQKEQPESARNIISKNRGLQEPEDGEA
jgi:hypothetical protein